MSLSKLATDIGLSLTTHSKCIGGLYPKSQIVRTEISPKRIPWSSEWQNYNPPVYNSGALRNKEWADPEIGTPGFYPKWNALEGQINRVSYMGFYTVRDGFPLNPIGRTGLAGRGILGRWGPNHAADPIVTRWKRSPAGDIIISKFTNKPILQVCVIQRADCGEWALPGGMVDPGEKVSATLKREFMEEAMNSLEQDQKTTAQQSRIISRLFSNSDVLYNGYVDDPRNTDNAWMETSAVNYHDNTGTELGALQLQAGDDAKRVQWIDANSMVSLYASHSYLVHAVVQKLQADW